MRLKTHSTIHDFNYTTLAGEERKMSDFSGSRLLIVNTALHCGLTPQLQELQRLYETYQSRGLRILAFPSNDFRQEWSTEAEIAEACILDRGLTFQLASKIHVRGEGQHPVYRWLTRRSENGRSSSFVLWNFQKYLVNADGSLHRWLAPWRKPFDRRIISWLED